MPGWNATQTQIGVDGPTRRLLESYVVHDCPEFVKEDRKHRPRLDLDPAGCYNLMECLLRRTRLDYIEGDQDERAVIENWLEDKDAMIQNLREVAAAHDRGEKLPWNKNYQKMRTPKHKKQPRRCTIDEG